MKPWLPLFMQYCAILALALLGACSNSQMECVEDSSENAGILAVDSVKVPVISVDSLRPGMMRVAPNGAYVLLGDGRMRVKLDYDYSLGIHEVTCGEFDAGAREEDWYFVLDCAQDDLPVTNVTYYDAVLFANAYSKSLGYDTVYTYHRQLFNSSSHFVNLEGLAVRTDVDGFRLPTEAEWVMAASLSWNPWQYSWNSSNSNYVIHAPCAFPDSLGFCDLAGNVLELTNDWAGDIVDATIASSMGALAGNTLLEKVVKGGSVYQSANNMDLGGRKDVYPVQASAFSSYMGFRLAFGKIPHATWLDAGGDVALNPVTLKTFSSAIRQKMGTVHSKLAFRNDKSGNLAYVDFYGGMPGVVEIPDSVPVYHPEISPDGNKVAFCTGMEGVGGPSSVYVRSLNAAGRLVKLDVENAAIPRWYVSEYGDTSIVYVDNAGDNSNDADFFASGTWMVPFSNEQFGKPEKILVGAYHGGVSLADRYAVSGARRLRVHRNGKDEIWYGGAQACNASLSKDGNNQTLFLDFGGDVGRAFANEKYGVHERLLVVDSTGKLIHAIPAPKGYSFDHPEWVDRDNWVVTALVNAKGEHVKLVLVNVLDSSVVDLVEGEELWHPNLWVMPEVPFGDGYFDLDSAGMYWDPIYQGGLRTVGLKMRMFWDMHDSLEVIAVGSSRTEGGFDPAYISKQALNFGYSGGDIWAGLYLMENYFVPHTRNLKYLIFEISYDLMNQSLNARNQTALGQASGYFYDKNHNFWKDGVPENFVRVVDANVPYTSEDSLLYVSTRGLLKKESHGWGDEPIIDRDSIMREGEYRRFMKSIDSLTAFIDSTQDKGFKIVGLIFPQSPEYANTGSYGRHGVSRSLAMKVAAYFDSLANVYPHFVLMDENKFGAHDYTDAMTNDCDHLSVAGAKQLSVRLDSLLNVISR